MDTPKRANKERKCRRLYCSKCNKGLGYPTSSRIKRYSSEEKLQKSYLCMKCRKNINYGRVSFYETKK